MSNSILAKLAVKIAADTAEFKGALAKTQNELKRFQGNIGTLAAQIGVAFGAQEVAQFVLEVSKLAGQAEGVKAAFDRLPGSTKLMLDLKDATHGTVSELDLMKRSVQAANFGISLRALPKLLEFATLRAQQTGQSVDYLVDSIITGIGRKSPLILDNLGISAVALKEKMDGVSIATADVGDVAEAVGKIAEDNLKTMGEFSENTQSKVERLNASWTNFKVTIGDAANGTGILGTAIDGVTSSLDLLSSKHTTTLEKLTSLSFAVVSGGLSLFALKIDDTNRALDEQRKIQERKSLVDRSADEAIQKFGVHIDLFIGKLKSMGNQQDLIDAILERLNKKRAEEIITLTTLNEKIAELNKQFETTDKNDTKKLKNIGDQILATRAQIDALEELRKKQEQLQTQFAKDQAAGKKPIVTDPLANLSDKNRLESAVGGTFSNAENKLLELNVPDITPQMNAYVEQINRGVVSLETWGDQMGILSDQQDEAARRQEEANQRQIASAMAVGDAVGDAIGSAITGQQKAADALKQLTASIIQQFLKQALAGIIASGATSGGPTPVALALAAGGVAAISAMFAKIGGSGSGGGASAGLSRQASRGISRGSGSVSNTSSFQVEGEFRIQGRDLVAAVAKNQKLDSQRKVS